jgi:hypothetical protein
MMMMMTRGTVYVCPVCVCVFSRNLPPESEPAHTGTIRESQREEGGPSSRLDLAGAAPAHHDLPGRASERHGIQPGDAEEDLPEGQEEAGATKGRERHAEAGVRVRDGEDDEEDDGRGGENGGPAVQGHAGRRLRPRDGRPG